MIPNYSASKRRNINRALRYDELPATPRGQGQYPGGFGENFGGEGRWIGGGRGRGEGSRVKGREQRDGERDRERQRERDKENCNYIQSRLDKYQTPSPSPLKQPLYSPLKQTPSLYESFTSRNSTTLRPHKHELTPELDPIPPVSARQGSARKERKSYGYGAGRGQYRRGNGSRVGVGYEGFQGVGVGVGVGEMKEPAPVTSRREYKRDLNLAITFSNATPYLTNIASTTPKKSQPEPDQLVQKSQFLRQRLQRLNRMTPKGATRRQEPSITPQKLPFAQPQSLQLYKVIKSNKYCTQKLPLQTIYDADQKHGHEKTQQHEPEPEEMAALQEINSLSRKISDRLKNIINRHNN